jgi:hypothetical protein
VVERGEAVCRVVLFMDKKGYWKIGERRQIACLFFAFNVLQSERQLVVGGVVLCLQKMRRGRWW